MAKKDLTAFLNQIILILQEDLTTGYLTRRECDDYLNMDLEASIAEKDSALAEKDS